MIPTNTLKHYVVKTKTFIQTHGSYIMGRLNKVNITITSDITNQLTHSWEIETTHAPISAK
jgi:hypothetical protein